MLRTSTSWTTAFPPAVRPAAATATDALLERIQWLRDRNAALRKETETLRGQRLQTRVKQVIGGRVRRILNR